VRFPSPFLSTPAQAGVHYLFRPESMDPACAGVECSFSRIYAPLMFCEQAPCVYILASKRHGRLYIGVTSDLLARLYLHRNGLVEGHTKNYEIKRLVWYEPGSCMDGATLREKQLKKWNRDWRVRLIEERNPEWVDLAIGLGFPPV
jgi:putative endonuclease